MATSVKSTFTNLIRMELDKTSVRRVRKQVKNLRRDLQSEFNSLKITIPDLDLGGGKGKRGKGGSNKFDKDYQIESFFLKSRMAYELDDIQKETIRNQLQETKNAKEFALASKRINQELITQRNLQREIAKTENKNKPKKTEATSKFDVDYEIKSFFLKSRLAYELNDAKKETIRNQLIETKNAKEFALASKRINQELITQRNLQRAIDKERKKKNGATSSKFDVDYEIKGFFLKSRLAYELNDTQKETIRNQLQETKNAKEFALESKRINQELITQRNLQRDADKTRRQLGGGFDKDYEINNFFLRNRLAYELSERQKEVVKSQLEQTKNAKEFREESRRINQELVTQRNLRRDIIKAQQRQNLLQSRFNSSLNQMAGTLASTYAIWEAGIATVRTGMNFEAIDKMFTVVSKGSEDAANNMRYARDEAMRLGTPLVETQKNFGRLMAAAGDKMSQERLRSVFSGVSEAAVALGLNQDEVAGTYRAIQQMMSKGKIQAEELTGQLGERLPFALRAMTKAASEAGLIDGSLTQQKQEQALYKLMENGKLISAEVLPHFGDALKDLANNGNAVAIALQNNLAPQLGRAKNVLTEMTNQFYKGLKPALHAISSGFADLGSEAGGLARMVGSTLSSALFTVTFPLRLVGAAIADAVYYIGDLLNLSDETKNFMTGWIPTIAGVAIGFMAISKAVGAVVSGLRTLKKVRDVIGTKGGVGGKGGATSGSRAVPRGMGGVLGKSLGALGIVMAGVDLYERLRTTNERTADRSSGIQV